MIELGDKVRDLITGIEGIVIVRSVWLNGCVQIGIKPALLEGKMRDTVYVDETQVERIGAGPVSPSAPGPSGDRPEALSQGPTG